MAFVTDSNRPQPLWQTPPTACLTASEAASGVPSLLMHPWGGARGGMHCGDGVKETSVARSTPHAPPLGISDTVATWYKPDRATRMTLRQYLLHTCYEVYTIHCGLDPS